MPTPYKVFLSVPDDPTAQEYLGAARTAIWCMDQMMITAASAADVAPTGEDRLTIAKQIMETTALFVGIYGASYGAVPEGAKQSYAEQEYRLAYQRGIVCAIFLAEEARQTTDERLKHFIEWLETTHVVNTFRSLQELQAKVTLAVDNFLKSSRQFRLLPPTTQYFSTYPAPAAPPAIAAAPGVVESLDTEANQAVRDRETGAAPTDWPRTATAPRRESAAPSPEPVVPPPAPIAPLAPQPAPVPPPAVPQPLDLETLVNEGMKFAADELEQIFRRALQVWDAQKQIAQDTPNDGWLRVNPLFGEPATLPQFRADVFMIMPFRDQFNGIYQNVVRPVVASLNLTLKRGDEFSSVTGVIMQEIWAAINACQLVIVEITEVNANVYYELGIAHTLGKPAILLTQATDVEQIPFDIRHLRYIRYSNTIEGGEKLSQDLRKAIVWILNDLKERPE
jgi:hypothetical protein